MLLLSHGTSGKVEISLSLVLLPAQGKECLSHGAVGSTNAVTCQQFKEDTCPHSPWPLCAFVSLLSWCLSTQSP